MDSNHFFYAPPHIPVSEVSGYELQVTGYYPHVPGPMPFASSIICLNVCCFACFVLLILRTS
jgi:hypothetical protein